MKKIDELTEAQDATELMSQLEIEQASDPDKGSIGEGIGNIIEALIAARDYVASDARNYKYPSAIETLALIDAALRRS